MLVKWNSMRWKNSKRSWRKTFERQTHNVWLQMKRVPMHWSNSSYQIILCVSSTPSPGYRSDYIMCCSINVFSHQFVVCECVFHSVSIYFLLRLLFLLIGDPNRLMFSRTLRHIIHTTCDRHLLTSQFSYRRWRDCVIFGVIHSLEIAPKIKKSTELVEEHDGNGFHIIKIFVDFVSNQTRENWYSPYTQTHA